jgi:mRNA-degrading endonuclease RelE of RelBE toxin-antitoxin system
MDHIDKLLSKIPPKHRLQILEALECLAQIACRVTLSPQKLAGSRSLFRIRAGRYRILFHVNERDQAIVDDIRLRSEKTYRDL